MSNPTAISSIYPALPSVEEAPSVPAVPPRPNILNNTTLSYSFANDLSLTTSHPVIPRDPECILC